MKQLLSLFLILVPCLALAQYPSNGNQKITLGEQTTADGLIYRGVAATDTVRKPSIDTMAYMVLDTTTNIMWHYKKATSNAWLRVGGSISSGLTGTLPVANGGTNTSTAFTAGSVVFAGASGTYTQDNSGLFWDNTNKRLGIGTSTPISTLDLNKSTGNLRFSVNKGANKVVNFGSGTEGAGIFGILQIYNTNQETPDIQFLAGVGSHIIGSLGLGITAPTEKLHVVGNARISGLANASNPVNVQVDVNGVLVRTSSIELKEHIESLPYGLNEILLLQPSKFNYKDKYKYGEGYDIGFIAEDVNNVIPEAVGTGVESDIFMDSVKIIPVLVKAIQEQNSLIKALEQRIINLENK